MKRKAEALEKKKEQEAAKRLAAEERRKEEGQHRQQRREVQEERQRREREAHRATAQGIILTTPRTSIPNHRLSYDDLEQK